MVKIAENGIDVTPENSGCDENRSRARKIGPETKYETCPERLTTFGGGLGFIKFLDLFQFEAIFEKFYLPPARKPLLGHYKMVQAILMLLIIGFTRLWHFLYVRLDPLLCAMIGVDKLPHATTFWRYVDSLGINQAEPLLKIAASMRERYGHTTIFCFRKFTSTSIPPWRRFTEISKGRAKGTIPSTVARRDSVR